MSLDVQATVTAVNEFLAKRGFTCPGADSDWRRGADQSLRFKTGTAYGEVAITIWHQGHQTGAIRIVNGERLGEALEAMSVIIDTHVFNQVVRAEQ